MGGRWANRPIASPVRRLSRAGGAGYGSLVSQPPAVLALRRCALAASVQHDLDLLPGVEGLTLTRAPAVRVSWRECRQALAGADPESRAGRVRLAAELLRRRWLADRSVADLAERARPVGVPVGSVRHPGLDWVRLRVLGSAIDLGLGFAGLDPDRPDEVLVVSQPALQAAGVPAEDWWPPALGYLNRMGELAAERYRRTPTEPLRPMGDCDVVTLLAAAPLRAALVAGEAAGLRAVAVPMRTRGWCDLSRTDPAFALAAAAATAAADRGFDRPVLVTADEVAVAPAGGRPAEVVLRDPAVADRPWLRDPLYR